MSKILSFIVPVYNVRDYVIRCLESLVKQDLPSSAYEIIIVNDGSQDDSLELVTEFSIKYDYIQIISQENRGLSEARNQGFKRSTGKYIWFIDSDDWITENCLSKLLNEMENKQLDMFGVAPSLPFQNNFSPNFDSPNSCSMVLSGKERLLSGMYVIGAWSYIFRSEFLSDNGLSFMKNIYFEDEEFTPRALFYAPKVMMLNHFSVYSYFIREGSITKTVSQRKITDKLLVAESLSEFSSKSISPTEKNMKSVFRKRINALVLSGINDIKRNKLGLDCLSSYLQEAKKNGLFPFCTKNMGLKSKILLTYWNYFPKFCYFLEF